MNTFDKVFGSLFVVLLTCVVFLTIYATYDVTNRSDIATEYCESLDYERGTTDIGYVCRNVTGFNENTGEFDYHYKQIPDEVFE